MSLLCCQHCLFSSENQTEGRSSSKSSDNKWTSIWDSEDAIQQREEKTKKEECNGTTGHKRHSKKRRRQQQQKKAAVLADKQQNSEFRPRNLSDLYNFNKKRRRRRRSVCLRAVLATATSAAAAKEFATADVLRKHLQLTPNCNLTRVIKSPSSAAAVVSLVSGG